MANAKTASKRGEGKKFRFADVFAGCGGLSLGLATAGWRGVFAVEKSGDAFGTLKANLVEGRRRKFDWPVWLPKEAITTTDLLDTHSENLEAMQGHIDLLAGGPPCQGFSLAGRRTHSDPRNSLTEDYISIVQKLKPRFLLIENVRGFTLPFKKHGDEMAKTIPYSVRVIERLEIELDYKVFSDIVDLSDYGVPQNRKRFILIAIRNGDPALKELAGKTPFDLLKKRRKHFLGTKGLPHDRAVSVKEAIGDLAIEGRALIDCEDSEVKGFKQIQYRDGIYTSPFISLMRKNMNKAPDSLRIPRHSESTVDQFRKIAETCPRGRTVHEDHRATLGIKKHALTPLAPDLPSATITTLPDDILHYKEHRILTVRENARIQTFPDWYKFKGKYTTGGKVRKQECPRYTQVGNAVPPLFSEAVGRVLRDLAATTVNT
ncbi:MAG: DNA cytosine methyltransferase [Sulfuritalea sp.]|nr:DNA cytosine methyltransferase [Sulfuritalea sp.]